MLMDLQPLKPRLLKVTWGALQWEKPTMASVPACEQADGRPADLRASCLSSIIQVQGGSNLYRMSLVKSKYSPSSSTIIC
jgi:hypothetical protein